MNILIYTPLMAKDMSTILFGANILNEACYVGTLFQSCQKLLLYLTLQIYLPSPQINSLMVSKITIPQLPVLMLG